MVGTLYPEPKLAYFRSDGEGGLQLVVVSQDGATQIQQVTPKRAASHLSILSEYVARMFKDQVKDK